MEFLGEFVAMIFQEVFLAGLGWLYLVVRYRDKAKRRKILNEKYDGNYSDIPRSFIGNLIYIIFGIPLIATWLI